MSAPRHVPIVNPANAVTACRFLALPPFLWAVSNDEDAWALGFMGAIALFDKVDGFVARVFDCRSTFGEMFDAVADGVCYGTCLVVLMAYGRVPVLPVALYIALGVLTAPMRLVYARRAGRVVNYKSYANERVIAAVVGLLLAGAVRYDHVTYYAWLLPVLGLPVFLWDARRMLVDPVVEAT